MSDYTQNLSDPLELNSSYLFCFNVLYLFTHHRFMLAIQRGFPKFVIYINTVMLIACMLNIDIVHCFRI